MTKNEAHEICDWWDNEGKYQTGLYNTMEYHWPMFVQVAFRKRRETKSDDKKRSTRKIHSMD